MNSEYIGTRRINYFMRTIGSQFIILKLRDKIVLYSFIVDSDIKAIFFGTKILQNNQHAV